MIGGVHIDQVGIQTVFERLDDTFGFVLTHQAVVHVHAYQLLADGLDQQSGYNGRIHAAGKGQQDLLVAHLSADLSHLLLDESVGQLQRCNTLHGIGTDIVCHMKSSIQLSKQQHS